MDQEEMLTIKALRDIIKELPDDMPVIVEASGQSETWDDYATSAEIVEMATEYLQQEYQPPDGYRLPLLHILTEYEEGIRGYKDTRPRIKCFRIA